MTQDLIYIKVAIALPVTEIFTYSVPESMNAIAKCGRRVLVPFGPRQVTGYILGFTEKPETYKVKNIVDFLDETALFTESMVSFFQWISHYYIYPIGETIKSAMPSGINIKDFLEISLLSGGERHIASDSCTPLEKKILSSLSSKPVSVKSITNLAGKKLSNSALYLLEEKGYILLEQKLSGKSKKINTESFFTYSGPENYSELLTPKRQKICESIQHYGEVSFSTLKKEHGNIAAAISYLQSENYIKTCEKQIFTDPLGNLVERDERPKLTPEQQIVVDTAKEKIGNGYQTFLLNGITGSGKTEVYMNLAEKALKKGYTSIVLVPEIALISQTAKRFRSRFGEAIAVIHSGLTAREKYDQWIKIIQGKTPIVIGARSAIFAPLNNIGLIIVDEEHDGSYKQENNLKYNARDLAVVRANLDGAVALLGSATPSVQSKFNVVSGKFRELVLTERVSESRLPEIQLVNLKLFKDQPGIRQFITPPLIDAIRQTLEKKEQVLLFLNRRGFASSPVCATCGEILKCRHCDISLTLHKDSNAYICHFCGYQIAASSQCPLCNSSSIKDLGMGTEKIEAAINALFPEAVTTRMDQDTTRQKGSIIKLLKNVQEKKTDVIIGTQMIAKGHDFPDITLVGIICADLSLNFPDFRACESTFQLLAQVSGRAGRGSKSGKVLLQTFNPSHYTITSAQQNDYDAFFETELSFRKTLAYPPFSRVIQLQISGKDRQDAKEFSEKTGVILTSLINHTMKLSNNVKVLGPVEAPIHRIAGRFRYQILMAGQEAKHLNSVVRKLLPVLPDKKNDIRLIVDVDPYSMS
jgi:primosomal protein N' (replication factor Y)